jgi:hypothetical protein
VQGKESMGHGAWSLKTIKLLTVYRSPFTIYDFNDLNGFNDFNGFYDLPLTAHCLPFTSMSQNAPTSSRG